MTAAVTQNDSTKRMAVAHPPPTARASQAQQSQPERQNAQQINPKRPYGDLGGPRAVAAKQYVAADWMPGEPHKPHPEEAGVQELRAEAEVKPATKDDYEARWKILEAYCLSRGWSPWEYSLELAYCFAAFMMKRRHHGRRIKHLDSYISAFNWKYKEALPQVTPEWAGEKLTRLKKAYYQLQVKKGRAEGEPSTRIRVPLPASVLSIVVQKAEQTACPTERAWLAVILLMMLLGYRSDTIAGLDPRLRPTDIAIHSDGSMTTVVNRLKRGNAEANPIAIQTPPGGSASHVRSRVIRVVAAARTDIGPQLFGKKPQEVAAKITAAMDEYLGSEIRERIPEHTFCSSHSMRKAGASALNAMNVSMFTLRRWGLWKTYTSPEKYCDQTYTVDDATRQLFDHLCEGGRGMGLSHVTEVDLTQVETDLTDDEEDTTWPEEITQIVPSRQ
jgi:hypothetical protein